MAEEGDDEYASHAARLSWVIDDLKQRRVEIAAELRAAFADFIETRQTEWVVFERVSVDDLARIFMSNPRTLKVVTALCNIAGRAITRDLGFSVDTYKPRLSAAQANQLAGYVKPFLPTAVSLNALEAVDDWWFIDKEIRAFQGRWERHTSDALTMRTGFLFKKRKFLVPDPSGQGRTEEFELDAAYPATGEPIKVAVDVKRIGAHRDIHKRSDEIAQKAEKYKGRYPDGRFGAVIYFPFDHTEQTNVVSRLRGSKVDGIVFAGDAKESVERAILMLIPQLGMEVTDDNPPRSLLEDL